MNNITCKIPWDFDLNIIYNYLRETCDEDVFVSRVKDLYSGRVRIFSFDSTEDAVAFKLKFLDYVA